MLSKVERKQAAVGVIGLGYVGLPLVRAFVSAGFRVLGFDTDALKITSLEKGESYIRHIPSDWLQDWIASGRFHATGDMGRLGEADVLLICVPTPLGDGRQPDLSFVESTCEAIARTLRPGQLVVLESTTYPGTTRSVMMPILAKSGLRVGADFFLAYSPEREDPGNPDYTAAGIPKLVGGYDGPSTKLAVALYSQAVVKIVTVSSCDVAEAAKILENTYRAVNVAMVNELKVIFDRLDIDVWEVIEAAKTKPFGFQAFYPGPGLGGHCIPIDPFYLSWIARREGLTTRFIELAGEINTAMPNYVVNRLVGALNDCRKPLRGSKIAILGVAYKKDVDDPRESPAFDIMSRIIAKGGDISYNDPYISRLPVTRRWPHLPELESHALTPAYLASQDAIVIVSAHTVYDFALVLEHAPLIVDTRNAMGHLASQDPHGKIHKA